MSDEIEMPNEVLERHEHTEGEKAHEHGKKHEHAGKITLLILILAMMAAVAGKISAETEIRYLTAEIELSDTWAQYQGKSDRQAIAQSFAKMAAVLPNAADPAVKALVADLNSTAARMDMDDKGEGKQQLVAKAKTLETERNRLGERMEGFSISVVLLAICIGLGSASMLTRSKKSSLTLACIAGITGLAAALYGLMIGLSLI